MLVTWKVVIYQNLFESHRILRLVCSPFLQWLWWKKEKPKEQSNKGERKDEPSEARHPAAFVMTLVTWGIIKLTSPPEATTNPTANPFFGKGKKSPIIAEIMIPAITSPPRKIQKKSMKAKFGAKKQPIVPKAKNSIPKVTMTCAWIWCFFNDQLIWRIGLTFVVVPCVEELTEHLFSSKLFVNLVGKRSRAHAYA